MLRRFFFLFLICTALLGPVGVRADHGSPDRVVNGTFVVTMLPDFETPASTLQFFFRDIQTGKPHTEPLTFTLSIYKDTSSPALFVSDPVSPAEGVGEITYTFPTPGIHLLRLEIETAAQPGEIYRPEEWSVWVPGEGPNPDRYPIGASEIAGISLLALSVGAVCFDLWRRRKAK